MALPAEADVRLLLSRLRPRAEYGWSGGEKNDFTRVVWRDQSQIEPTEAEYLAEHTALVAENSAAATLRSTLALEYEPLVGLSVGALLEAQRSLLLELLLYSFGAIDDQRNLKPLRNWRITLNP